MFQTQWFKRSLAVAVMLLGSAAVFAGGPPYGIPSGVLQNEWYKYRGYENLYHGAREPHPSPATVEEPPSHYALHIYHPGVKHTADDPNMVVLMAHVPVDASVFFDGAPTTQTGKVRWFETIPLVPGYNYSYKIRVVWNEDGKWVSETQKVSFKAGDIQCIHLKPVSTQKLDSEIAANLAKLSPEDGKLARAQEFCAVQSRTRLGEMGVPVKIMIKGQPVFLCCNGCEKTALSHSDATLATVAKMRARVAGGAAY